MAQVYMRGTWLECVPIQHSGCPSFNFCQVLRVVRLLSAFLRLRSRHFVSVVSGRVLFVIFQVAALTSLPRFFAVCEFFWSCLRICCLPMIFIVTKWSFLLAGLQAASNASVLHTAQRYPCS